MEIDLFAASLMSSYKWFWNERVLIGFADIGYLRVYLVMAQLLSFFSIFEILIELPNTLKSCPSLHFMLLLHEQILFIDGLILNIKLL